MPIGQARAASAAVLAGALLVLAGLATTGGPLLSAHPARWRHNLLSHQVGAAPPTEPVRQGPHAATYAVTPPPPSDGVPHWVSVVAAVVGVAALSLLLAYLASVLLRSSLWRALVPAIEPTESVPNITHPVEDSRDLLARRVEAALGVLEEGDPRAAVIASWRRLELAVAELGVERAPTETSAELAARILGSLAVDNAAVRRLSTLYRTARFSPHPVDESDRGAARQALRTLRSDLDRLVSTSGTS